MVVWEKMCGSVSAMFKGSALVSEVMRFSVLHGIIHYYFVVYLRKVLWHVHGHCPCPPELMAAFIKIIA